MSHSLDAAVFSLVDDAEALIKVNIDIIDLSHSVTDESDDTAFCQATIEFNSLDVIGQTLLFCNTYLSLDYLLFPEYYFIGICCNNL